MKLTIDNHIPNGFISKILHWVKLISLTGGTQLVVQLTGLASGIIIIRFLTTKEYALYTLANTMLGTLSVLADGGISSGTMSQGGKVWQNKVKLGAVLSTGLNLRKKFAVASLVIATPILLFLLLHHNAGWLMSGLIIFSLIPAFYTALSGNIFQIALKLHQDIIPLQVNSAKTNFIRLGLTAVSLFVFPWAFIAILVSGFAQFWANLNLRKISIKHADWKQAPDYNTEKEILGVVKRIMPGSVYYCISSQLTIWLISIFGSTIAIAQVGALGRISMMLGLFSVILNTLVVPRFARQSNEKKKLLRNFLMIQVGLILLGISIAFTVFIFPNQILWILGNGYVNLRIELLLTIVGSCLGLIAGTTFGLATSRGWAIHPLISIPLTITSIIIGSVLIDISTITGILKFNIFVTISEIVMYYVYCSIKISRAFEENII